MRVVYLSTGQVRARYGDVSQMWVHRRTIKGGFPHPVHLGGSRRAFYKLDEIEAWEANPDNHVPPPVNVERMSR